MSRSPDAGRMGDWRSIVDTVRDPLLVLDESAGVVSANRSFYRTFGVTPRETVGRPLSGLGGGQWDVPGLAERLRRVVLGGHAFDGYEMTGFFPGLGERTMRLDGRRLYRGDAAAPSAPSAGAGGEENATPPGVLLLAIEDVTESRRAAEAERHSEVRYRRLFETAQDGILILDVDNGRITDSNPFMSELLGYSREELEGKELWQIGLFSDQGASREAFRRLQETGYIRYEDLPLQTRGGERRDVEFVSNVYRENGKTVIQCNVRDITARRAAEKALRAAFERERRIADILQRPLTVEVAPDAFPGLSVASVYAAAAPEAEVGGDFYDAFALPGGAVALAVADASGKGLLSAARTMQVKDVLRAFARETPQAPGLIVARLNDFVCDARRFGDAGDESFVCLALAVLDARTGEGTVVCAGCEPVLLLRADGAAETVGAPGIVLGVLAGERYDAAPVRLGPGDALLLVSDGLTEARRGKDFLEYEGFVALARQSVRGVADPRDAAHAILEGARAFAGGPLHDDACLLLVRRD